MVRRKIGAPPIAGQYRLGGQIAVTRALVALSAVAALLLGSGPRTAPMPDGPTLIGGPVAWLLSSSADLGSARIGRAQLAVALQNTARPQALIEWASRHDLSLRWRPGDAWGYLEGVPGNIAAAFGVPVHDYRSRSGQVFYASAWQPAVPAPVRGEVAALGHILSYNSRHLATPANLPRDVPKDGLTPDGLLTTYNAEPLKMAGFTGKGQTIVFFEIDGYNQADLDSFAALSGLPPLTPLLIGGQPGPSEGETEMDLEVAHAIAPEAQLVVMNAYAAQGNSNYDEAANMFTAADRQFPGAVWSSSIGVGCDRMTTAADLAPAQSALVAAEAHGTSAFDASGDTGGLECKEYNGDWSTPPGESDRGLDSLASLPAMTDVGGTTLSTDANGVWLAEETWVDSPMSQGTGGGVSALFSRPAWQKGVSSPDDTTHRLTPDVAADADPYTGVRILEGGQVVAGGGTSQSAPIWAGMAVLMNQFLVAHGGHILGDLNPLLYRVAAAAARPAFHDVALGGNVVATAASGYDLTTGLGTPDVDNLVHDLLDLQLGSR